MGNDIDNKVTIYAMSKEDMTSIYEWFLSTFQQKEEYNEYGVFKLLKKYDMNMTFNIMTKHAPFYSELVELNKKYNNELWIKCDWEDMDAGLGVGIFFISKHMNQDFHWREPAEGYFRSAYPNHNHLAIFNKSISDILLTAES
jgi:hypothetical protein